MDKVHKSFKSRRIVFVCALVFHLLSLTGCNSPTASSPEQVKIFQETESIIPTIDANAEGKTRLAYAYRLIPGDVLEFQMPAILRKLSSDSPDWLAKIEPHSCRVGNDGTITLPIVGKIPAAGKTLAEVESSVVDAYYPKYVVDIPAVVGKVTEHLNQRVFTVLGLVKEADAFPYPPNVRYNLMEALAFAGGVNAVADPHYVNVYRQSANGQIVSATFRIDQEFLIGAYDVVIKPGDVVYVSETARTKMNTFVNDVLNINVGAYARPFDD